MKRLEEIILATLDLASINGLGNVSLQMIADKVGIKKSSLFNHIENKDDLLEKMYNYLRENAKKSIPNIDIDFSKSTFDILYYSFTNYLNMCLDKKLNTFYKLIYSERAFNAKAKHLVIEETNKMVNATYYLFTELSKRNKLNKKNLRLAAIEYAFTIHNFIDYYMDNNSLNQKPIYSVEEFIKYFIGDDTYEEEKFD